MIRRIDKEELDRQARDRWLQTIAHCANLAPGTIRPRKPGPCPVPGCGGRNRFRFDDKDGRGTFFCSHCGAGDGYKLLMLITGWGFPQTLEAVADCIGMQQGSNSNSTPTLARIEADLPIINPKAAARHQYLLAGSLPAAPDTATFKYLTINRGLPLLAVPDAIRHHPGMKFFDDDRLVGVYPVMLAEVIGPTDERVTLHATYITEDGAKAFGSDSRRLQTPIYPGATAGGAVRLFPAGEVLGIAEGIETALACHLMTGLPVWSAINEGCMRKVVIPDDVRKVVIFADNDHHGKGEEAATELARRLQQERRSAEVRIPALAGEDWLDVFNKQARTTR